MRLDRICAAFAAALLVASPGVGGTRERTPFVGTFELSCTVEQQKCVEKLETQLHLHDRIHDRTGIENVLYKLHETDPECALVLQGLDVRDQ